MNRVAENHWDLAVGQTVYTTYPDDNSAPVECVIEEISRSKAQSQSGCRVKIKDLGRWLDTYWIYNA